MKEKESLSQYKQKQVEKEFLTTKPEDNVIRVTCPSCNEPAQMEHINIHDKIAKCGNCAAVFSFEQEVNHLAKAKEKIAQEENIARPVGIEKSYFKDELELSMTQPTGGGWIVFMLLAGFFAGLLYMVHLKKGIPIYWPAGFAAFIPFFIYKQWNSVREKIFITIDDAYLSVQYRPKNLIKDKLAATNEVDQLYIKNIQGSTYYSLHAILNTADGQKHKKLIAYLDSRAKARYIEREIEKYLGIEDRRVPEEQMQATPINISVDGSGF